VIAHASLTEYEATEALFRMLEAAGSRSARAGTRSHRRPRRCRPPPVAARPWGRELVFAGCVILAIIGLRAASRLFVRPASAARPAVQDVYLAAQLRDLRLGLELYRREQGATPTVSPAAHGGALYRRRAAQVPGYELRYQPVQDGAGLHARPQRPR
jgi:hypothetical protein